MAQNETYLTVLYILDNEIVEDLSELTASVVL